MRRAGLIGLVFFFAGCAAVSCGMLAWTQFGGQANDTTAEPSHVSFATPIKHDLAPRSKEDSATAFEAQGPAIQAVSYTSDKFRTASMTTPLLAPPFQADVELASFTLLKRGASFQVQVTWPKTPSLVGKFLQIIKEVPSGQYERVDLQEVESKIADDESEKTILLTEYGSYFAWVSSNDDVPIRPSDAALSLNIARMDVENRIDVSEVKFGLANPSQILNTYVFSTRSYSAAKLTLNALIPRGAIDGVAQLHLNGQVLQSKPLTSSPTSLGSTGLDFSLSRVGKFELKLQALAPDASGSLVVPLERSITIEIKAETSLDAPVIQSTEFHLSDKKVRFAAEGRELLFLPRDGAVEINGSVKANAVKARIVDLVLGSDATRSLLASGEVAKGSDAFTVAITEDSRRQLGQGTYIVRSLNQFTREESAAIQVVLPEELGMQAPELTHSRTTRMGAQTFLMNSSVKATAGFLELAGHVAPGAEATLVLLRPAPDEILEPVRKQSLDVQADGRWAAEVDLAGIDHVYVLARSGGDHAYSKLVLITRGDGSSPPIPETGIVQSVTVKDGKALVADGEENAVKTDTAVLNVALKDVTEGDAVFVKLNRQDLEPTVIEQRASAKEKTVTLSGLREGSNQVEVRVGRGANLTNTTTLAVIKKSTSPQIGLVSPSVFRPRPGDSRLKIFFQNGPMDHTQVQVKANYKLYRKSAPDSAYEPVDVTFDSTSQSVELTFREGESASVDGAVFQAVNDAYELRITSSNGNDGKPGLRDAVGNALVDKSGNGNPQITVSLGGAASGSLAPATPSFALRSREALPLITVDPPISRTSVPGLAEATGNQVDYPEFTPPRPFLNGFNPADKVVSRVARLYYARDAHRIVQIINRRAKSYNAQNASMSRQLADQARVFAQQTTNRRQAAERQAVEAASYARQAETAIEGYEQERTRAKKDVQDGTLHQRQLQQALTQITAQQQTLPAESEDAQRLQESRGTIEAELQELSIKLTTAEENESIASQRLSATTAALEALRERELQDRETMNRETGKEDRAIEDQFRLEVYASQADPDTYAEGRPNSEDPVAQVSLAVIGEGLIQMRGPIKGVNIVHTMINQIDSPVGQVRIGVHTVQINGERAPRMEEVAGRIERYIDHSRFLTTQSAQMLRNAVAQVASHKAQQVGLICRPDMMHVTEASAKKSIRNIKTVGHVSIPNMNGGYSGVSTEAKYQDAFFGAEFMAELRVMDSEFVRPGNKLLSLHSMSTTSLSSALFAMALASNETRMEILAVFQQMVQCKLPIDEIEYFDASGIKQGFGCAKFNFLASKSHFVSLRGQFDAAIAGDNTLNPVQWEFIKLAQILKSRLITERELKNNVMARALIEERLGNRERQLKQARQSEANANNFLLEASRELQKQISNMLTQLEILANEYEEQNRLAIAKSRERVVVRLRSLLSSATISAINLSSDAREDQVVLKVIADTKEEVITLLLDDRFSLNQKREGLILLVEDATRRVRKLDPQFSEDPNGSDAAINVTLNGKELTISFDPDHEKDAVVNNESLADLRAYLARWSEEIRQSSLFVGLSDAGQQKIRKRLNQAERSTRADRMLVLDVIFEFLDTTSDLRQEFVAENNQRKDEAVSAMRDVLSAIRHAGRAAAQGNTAVASAALLEAHRVWIQGRRHVSDSVSGRRIVINIDQSFNALLQRDTEVAFALAAAEKARRPLDQKKFLDMLIDEAEEKHIELLEGTRAHTAVIDDYVKRIATALEDDFNTQYYDPAFRHLRETTYGCRDVSLGQIEHTTVLTNNREFAKVKPQATMEFDLPRRRIMIAEAMQGAQAAFNDYGALMNDPTFLAMVKLNGGQPTAARFGGSTEGSAVRSLLPGLPSDTGESSVIQAQSNQPAFASQLESLIPDPAIYKFETGTGFELRPVIQPDGQSVVFDFKYMYTTNIREPVRADEKHLGRVKRHYIDTDVQVGNYELREVSRYRVALKASRTSRGVPLLEDIPIAGALFRPLANSESSLQQNIILAQTVIYPTMFDLMGLRWAPSVADVDVQQLREAEMVARGRLEHLNQRVSDGTGATVDDFLRIPQGERRADLYRPQNEIRRLHPNGYLGPGLDLRDAPLEEGGDNYPSSDAGSVRIDSFQGEPAQLLRLEVPRKLEFQMESPQSSRLPAIQPQGPISLPPPRLVRPGSSQSQSRLQPAVKQSLPMSSQHGSGVRPVGYFTSDRQATTRSVKNGAGIARVAPRRFSKPLAGNETEAASQSRKR